MAVYLIESKADQQKLIDYVGEDTAKLFFSMKDRLKSPENDIYYWLKKKPYELVNRLSELQTTKTHKQKEEDAREGAYLLYEDDDWKVYEIDTYPAAVKYGKGTQWCISGSKRWNNGEQGEDYFNDYKDRGINFYFFLNKKDSSKKYAFAHSMISEDSYQVFNAEDDDITYTDLHFLPQVDIGPGVIPYFPEDNEEGLLNYNGYGDYHANNNIKLVSVHCSEVGNSVFQDCKSLECVRFNGVSIIGDSSFAGCTSLEEVEGLSYLRYIGEWAFSETGLYQIDFLGNLSKIRTGTFYNCHNLYQLVFPDSIEWIEEGAFEKCTALDHIYLSPYLGVISDNAFKGCSNLKSVSYFNKSKHLIILGDDIFKECHPNLIVRTNDKHLEDYCKSNGINIEMTEAQLTFN